jgi:hypothetical protein
MKIGYDEGNVASQLRVLRTACRLYIYVYIYIGVAALHTVSFEHGCFAGKCILTGSTE